MLSEPPCETVQMLHLRHPSVEALAAIGRLLGVILPVEPNHAEGDRPRAIWAGPDQWMIVGAEPAPQSSIGVEHGTVLLVDASSGRYAMDVAGPLARDFLAKAIAIDLHPARFPPDRSAMTLFAQVPVLIDHSQTDRFRLWFDISHKDYVHLWCDDALVEFGVAATAGS